MTKFSTPGSPFQNIWTVYEDLSMPVSASSNSEYGDRERTSFDQGQDVSHILHEDSTLELQLWFPFCVYNSFATPEHLILGLVRIDLLAAKQDPLKKINLVLSFPSSLGQPRVSLEGQIFVGSMMKATLLTSRSTSLAPSPFKTV